MECEREQPERDRQKDGEMERKTSGVWKVSLNIPCKSHITSLTQTSETQHVDETKLTTLTNATPPCVGADLSGPWPWLYLAPVVGVA